MTKKKNFPAVKAFMTPVAIGNQKTGEIGFNGQSKVEKVVGFSCFLSLS
jgi:hypothetical protein